MTAVDEPGEVEFYTLPSADDYAYWERAIAAGIHQPLQEQNGTSPHGWQRINLADPAYAVPPDPPTILGLIYDGKRHVISGPPESTKTLVAYILLLEAQRAGQTVAIVDFEMGPTAARRLLGDVGATENEIAAIHYYEPDSPPANGYLALVVAGVRFVLIDAAAGAYDTSGLDDNARKDAEAFARTWIRPLWQAGVTTLVVDHVTKNADTRGKFTIGSERKVGQADVHISLEAVKSLSRGHTGIVKATVHKDRPGFLPRPTACMFHLSSDPDTHIISWEQKEPIAVEPVTGEFRHTIYMERVSKVMESNPGHAWSKNELEDAVEGKRDHIRQALNELVTDEHVIATESGKWLRYTLVRPFAPGSPPVRPGEHATNLAPSPHPLRGGQGEGRGEPGEENPGAGANPLRPEIAELADRYDDELRGDT